MSFQEKRSVANLISAILITALYSAYVVQRFPEENAYSVEVFRFWGAFFVLLIPVSIIARIVIYIVFRILNAIAMREEEAPITDERDHLIEMKSLRYSLYVFAIGFLLAISSLVVDMPPSVMFVILICAGLIAEMVSEISHFYFYRRGV